MEHVKSINGLVHGYHVACFIDSEESEVTDLLDLACNCTVDDPVGVGSVLELALARPGYSIGPCLTTAPVADEILIS